MISATVACFYCHHRNQSHLTNKLVAASHKGTWGKATSEWVLLNVFIKRIRQKAKEGFIGAWLLPTGAHQRPLFVWLFVKLLSKKLLDQRITLTVEDDEESVE